MSIFYNSPEVLASLEMARLEEGRLQMARSARPPTEDEEPLVSQSSEHPLAALRQQQLSNWDTETLATQPESPPGVEPATTSRNTLPPIPALPELSLEPHPGTRMGTPAEAPTGPIAEPLPEGSNGFPFPAVPSAGPSVGLSSQPLLDNPAAFPFPPLPIAGPSTQTPLQPPPSLPALSPPGLFFAPSSNSQQLAENPAIYLTPAGSSTAEEITHNATSGDPDAYCPLCLKLLPTPENPGKMTYLLCPDIVAFGITQKYAVGCTHKFHITCFMDRIRDTLSSGTRYTCPVCHFSLLDPDGKVRGKVYVPEVGPEGNLIIPSIRTRHPENATMTMEPDYVVFDFTRTIEQYEYFYSHRVVDRAKQLQWLELFDTKFTPDKYALAENILLGRSDDGEEFARAKMDVNIRHPMGNLTALHIAAIRDDPIAIGLLLRHRAKQDLRSSANAMTLAGTYGNNGMTALEIARTCLSREALKALGVALLPPDFCRLNREERRRRREERAERAEQQGPGRMMEQMEIDDEFVFGGRRPRRERGWIFSQRTMDRCMCARPDDVAGQCWDIMKWFGELPMDFYRHFLRVAWWVRRHR